MMLVISGLGFFGPFFFLFRVSVAKGLFRSTAQGVWVRSFTRAQARRKQQSKSSVDGVGGREGSGTVERYVAGTLAEKAAWALLAATVNGAQQTKGVCRASFGTATSKGHSRRS